MLYLHWLIIVFAVNISIILLNNFNKNSQNQIEHLLVFKS